MKKYVFVKTGEAVELGQKLARVANTLLGPVVSRNHRENTSYVY